MKNIFLISIYLSFFSCAKQSLSADTDNVVVTIKQKYYDKEMLYHLESDELIVYEVSSSFENNQFHKKYKKVFSTKLSSNKQKEVASHIDILSILESEYIGKGVGGVDWYIELLRKSKKISLFNARVYEANDFFEFLNEVIPKSKYKILVYPVR